MWLIWFICKISVSNLILNLIFIRFKICSTHKIKTKLDNFMLINTAALLT